MKPTDDWQLLDDYAQQRSEDAFRLLVDRYAGLVYHAALRQAGNPHTAQEVTQAVFIALARKADRIPRGTILAAWLFRATRFALSNLARQERRRQFREEEAVRMETIFPAEETESVWERLAPHLNDALDSLSSKDREAILTRFFHGGSHREVASLLGVSEDAAKVRVGRALEKLRLTFAARGLAVPSAVLLATLSARCAQAAPEGLACAVMVAAIAKGTATSTSTLTLTKGILKLMSWTKAKTAVVSSIGLLLVSGTAIITIKEIQKRWTYPWQVAQPNSREGEDALNRTRPQITVVPSKYARSQHHGKLLDDIPPKDEWRYIGINQTPVEMLRTAGDADQLLPSQIIAPPDVPGGTYDYIANRQRGSQPALQALLKKRFGLIGKRERREMDVLLLKVARPGALGLQPGTPHPPELPPPRTRVSDGFIHYKNQPISVLARNLEIELQIPIIDQTGLTGTFDLEIPDELDGSTSAEKLDAAQQYLRESFGLVLIPSRQLHDVFLIEKAN